MATIDDADLPEPRRTVNKQEALRHLIHAAIRLVSRMEDPFAVQLLVHSADKILIDLAKQRGRELAIDWALYIKPEYHEEFFKRHRRTYNYFKHADRDFAADLPVRDIANNNVMNLFITVMNYTHLFGEWTDHMRLLQSFVLGLIPEIIQPTDSRGIAFLKSAYDIQDMTPAQFFQMVRENPEALPNLDREVASDVEDLVGFYNSSFRKMRESKQNARAHSTARRTPRPST